MNPFLAVLLALTMVSMAWAGSVSKSRDADTGWDVYTLTQGNTELKVVPAAGCNAYSFRHSGTEIYRKVDNLKDVKGFMFGTPVLYPTPNRVRGAVLTFEGQSYKFPDNNNGNFLHGLVHSVPWDVKNTRSTDDGAAIDCELVFKEGSEPFKLFPFPHTLKLTIEARNDSARWTYTVDNASGSKRVPFGFALHPWFVYQGERSQTYLKIPATNLMESEKLLPTGKLLELSGTKYDARNGIPLEGFVVDDVYYGLRSDSNPATIDFRDKKLAIVLAASPEFKHMVVYTPANEPWFCVENQTCSTDAHNLHAKGLAKESNLQIVEPGKTASGWIEYRVTRY